MASDSASYLHREAFCLMWYACRDCGARERLWNSRDGVTPFGIGCRSCGKIMDHVEWNRDECAPDHKPIKGQRIFRDGTPDDAELIMRARIASMRKKYPLSVAEEARLIRSVRDGSEMGEFQKGWPMLDVAP